MAAKPTDKIKSRIESKTWWLIGLSILIILGFSVTIPLLLLSLVRAGVLEGVLPSDGGFSLVVGLLGLAAVFSLNLVYQQTQIDKMRRRMIQDQLDLEQSKSRLAELTSLFQLGNSLHLDLPLQTILEITVRRIGSTLHAHDVDAFLFSRETKSLHCAASNGLAPRPPQPEVPYGEGPVGWCARHRQPIFLVAGEKGVPFAEFLAAQADTGSILFVPVRADKVCVGVLQISRSATAEPFRAEHRDVAQLFADNVGPLIERARGAAVLRQNTAAVASAPPPVDTSVGSSFQDSLLHNAGQVLKSPLTTILAYSEVLNQNDKRLTPAMRSEFSARVRTEAHRTISLVDDVIDLVRLELGRYVLELRVGNVNDVVKEAVEAVQFFSAPKEIVVEVSLDEKIPSQHLDLGKLRHSVIHLLRNAIRYSPAKSRVGIATKRGETEIRIEVLDRGPGIDAVDCLELFELDVAARNEEKRPIGVGIGLHLMKRFVELQGGTVGAAPSANGGSLFWIELPWSNDLSTLVGEGTFAEELTRF